MKITYDIKCPKCNRTNKSRLMLDKELYNIRVNEFDFSCDHCKTSYFYQYGMISFKNEMSTYKNDYTSEIHKIVHDVKEELANKIL